MSQFEKKNKKMYNNKTNDYWKLVHEISAIISARVLILGPIERMKIILQTKHLAKYANPKSDMPTGFLDLISSKSLY